MAERVIPTSTYVIIGVILVLLTFMSVGVSFIPMPGDFHILAGLLFGTTKATLVVLFFMHALYSSRLTWLVILVALVWLSILFVLTFNDYITREWLPFAPGH